MEDFQQELDSPRPWHACCRSSLAIGSVYYNGIIYFYRAEKYKADRVATAATNSDWKKINKVLRLGDRLHQSSTL